MSQPQPRIALFLRNVVGGGAERVMLNLAAGIVQQGYPVDLVLTKAEGAYLDRIAPGVRLVDLKASQYDKNIKLPTSFQSTTSLPKLVRYLQRERPTALLSATHFPNEIATIAKHLSRVPVRVVVSEHTHLSAESRRVEQISARFAPIAARIFYPGADAIVAVSQGVATDLSQITRIPLNRIHTIYNPIITPELITKTKENIDHPWFAPNEPPVVLGIGRLVEQKNFSTLIRAFAKVRQVRPARLMMLGNGRQKAQLETLAKSLEIDSDIAWIGFAHNPFPYMKQAGVLVLSSAWEGFGNVLVEGLSVGVPIVSTDCPSGPAEILDRGKYGKLVPVEDSDAMAEAILQVLSEQRKPVDRAWLDQFTLESVTRQYLQVLLPSHNPFKAKTGSGVAVEVA